MNAPHVRARTQDVNGMEIVTIASEYTVISLTMSRAVYSLLSVKKLNELRRLHKTKYKKSLKGPMNFTTTYIQLHQ